MHEEIDKEIATKKVTSNPTTPVEGYSVSEQQSTKVSTDNSGALWLGVILCLGVAGAAAIYFLNDRPTTPIVVPSLPNTVRDKSTVIERNNTTIKEVAPAPTTPPTTPNVEVNVPPSPPSKVEINVPPAPTAPPQSDTSVPPTN
jgi:hypothetical protein